MKNRYTVVILAHLETDADYWNYPFGNFPSVMECWEHVSLTDFYGRSWKVIDTLRGKELTSKEVIQIALKTNSR